MDMDEQMRIVMEMSRVAQEEQDKAAQEEEEMIRLAIEASQAEEARRVEITKKEEQQIQSATSASAASAMAQSAAAQQEEVKQPEGDLAGFSPQDQMPVAQPAALVKVKANVDPEQARREEEKLKQLAALKKAA